MNFREEIIKAAVLGTDKKLPNIELAPPSIHNLLQGLIEHDKEKAGLIALSALLYYRVGQLPYRMPLPHLNVAPKDNKPQCNLECARQFSEVISLLNNFPEVLHEWLVTIHIAGKRVPEECLVILLDSGMTNETLQLPIIDVIGDRGRWLAKQNPEWSYASGEDNLIWEEGTPSQRLTTLKRIRHRHPAKARELLKSTWSKEPALARNHFLQTFFIELSFEDQEFLESLAKDRSKEVRATAADLLKCLPYTNNLKEILRLPVDNVKPMLFMSMSEVDRDQFLITSLKIVDKNKNFSQVSKTLSQVSSFFTYHNCMWSEELSRLILETMKHVVPYRGKDMLHDQLLTNVGCYLNLAMIDEVEKWFPAFIQPYLNTEENIEVFLAMLIFRRTMIEEIYND